MDAKDKIKQLERLRGLKQEKAKLAAQMEKLDREIQHFEKELDIESWNIPQELLEEMLDGKKRSRKPNFRQAEKQEMFQGVLNELEPEQKILIPLRKIRNSLLHTYGLETTTAPLRVFLGFENEVVSNKQLQLELYDKRESFLIMTAEEAGITKKAHQKILKRLGL